MRSNDVYSVHIRTAVAPGASYGNVFWLNNFNKQFKIKSISWDYKVRNSIGGKVDEDLYSMSLVVGDGLGAAPKISKSFEAFTTPPITPAVTDFNGTRFYIQKPKQLFFNSWFIENGIPFKVEIDSDELLNTYNFYWSLVVETEVIGWL
jgi:hypothetical protein